MASEPEPVMAQDVGLVCWVCQFADCEGHPEEPLLSTGCACLRAGSSGGRAHVSCLAGAAAHQIQLWSRCPTCRADNMAMLVTPMHTVASLIEELPVRCPCGVLQAAGGGAEDFTVAPDGCDAVVPRGQLAAHTVSCPFEPVGCAQAGHGCGWRGARRGLAEHADSCWYESGRLHLERAAELNTTHAAAAEKAQAELAKVRAEAAAQLETLETLQAAVKSLEERDRQRVRKKEAAAQLKRVVRSSLTRVAHRDPRAGSPRPAAKPSVP
jgi:hypothetical protein